MKWNGLHNVNSSEEPHPMYLFHPANNQSGQNEEVIEDMAAKADNDASKLIKESQEIKFKNKIDLLVPITDLLNTDSVLSSLSETAEYDFGHGDKIYDKFENKLGLTHCVSFFK
jgi:hypothetical protein